MADSKNKGGCKTPISIIVDGKFIGTDLEKLSKNRFMGINFNKLLNTQKKKVTGTTTFRIFFDKRGLILLMVFIVCTLVIMGLLYYFLN